MSKSCTVNPKLPAPVGVPDKTPPALRVNPGGRLDPEARDHEYEPDPPLAWNVKVYGVPTVPGASGELLAIANPAAICNWKVRVTFPPAVSTTLIPKDALCGVVGVPLSSPEAIGE